MKPNNIKYNQISASKSALGNNDGKQQERIQKRYERDKALSSNNGLSNSRTNATYQRAQAVMDPDEVEYTEWMKKHLQDLSVAENQYQQPQMHFKKADQGGKLKIKIRSSKLV